MLSPIAPNHSRCSRPWVGHDAHHRPGNLPNVDTARPIVRGKGYVDLAGKRSFGGAATREHAFLGAYPRNHAAHRGHIRLRQATMSFPHAPGRRGPIPTAVSRAGAASSSVTTLSRFLYWWTRQITVRAVDAAIPRLRLEQDAAAPAFIEELASVCWHRLGRLMAARRAGDRRNESHFNAPERA
jgi:hypothetical protein